MNLIGYDAMAVGNHEFDNPLSVLRQQEKWAKFPVPVGQYLSEKHRRTAIQTPGRCLSAVG